MGGPAELTGPDLELGVAAESLSDALEADDQVALEGLMTPNTPARLQ